MDLYFLTLQDVLEIHADQIDRYGGIKGVRDQKLLQSAIAKPHSTFDGLYLHPTIYDKAAAYLYYICKNHPFIDGNKLVALVSSLIFLAMNNCSVVDYKEDALEGIVRLVAESKAKKEEVAVFLSKALG